MTRAPGGCRAGPPSVARPRGLVWLGASEACSVLLGFAATVHVARTLGPDRFALLEFAAVITAWLLVAVRSGVEQVVQREAARNPRLIGPLTNQLIALKWVAALACLVVILLIAGLLGGAVRWPLMFAGLILVPSALTADVGPRARGEFQVVAVAQGFRALSLLVATFALVRSEADLAWAALAPVVGELASALYLLRWQHRHVGPLRPTLRPRAVMALIRRGAIASLARFARVGTYGADLIVLGWLLLPESGAYAASRRVVFAAASIGLAVSAGYAPTLARTWASGREPAREALRLASRRVLLVSGAVALGWALVGPQVLPLVFGASYRIQQGQGDNSDSGIVLPGTPRWPFGTQDRSEGVCFWWILLAARLPVLLLSGLALTALVAHRRERQALGLTVAIGLALAAGIALAWRAQSLESLALSVLVAETFGALTGGWLCLRGPRVTPSRRRPGRRPPRWTPLLRGPSPLQPTLSIIVRTNSRPPARFRDLLENDRSS